jgi:uncharacterized protein
MVCADPQLADLDARMAQAYERVASGMADADFVKLDQQAWLAGVRDKCRDTACLARVYAARIERLDGVASRGPAGSHSRP